MDETESVQHFEEVPSDGGDPNYRPGRHTQKNPKKKVYKTREHSKRPIDGHESEDSVFQDSGRSNPPNIQSLWKFMLERDERMEAERREMDERRADERRDREERWETDRRQRERRLDEERRDDKKQQQEIEDKRMEWERAQAERVAELQRQQLEMEQE